MSPRPRTVTDEEVLQVARRAIGRVGPNRLTLARVADGCGLSPATLLQRFGSKHNLILELARSETARSDAVFARAFRPEIGLIEQLVEALASVAATYESPDSAANLLAFQLIESSVQAYHDQLVSQLDAELSTATELIQEAVADGELTDCNPGALARALIDVRNGALLSWAMLRRPDAPPHVRAALATVLEPWRARPRVR